MENEKVGVHITHCCIIHGCKYGDDNCPVENGAVEQEHICEYCWDAGIKNIDMLKDVVFGRQATCPYCGHVV